MSELRNPAGTAGDLAKIIVVLRDRIKQLEDEVRDLRQVQRTYHQVATVTTYVSGDFATVTFDSGAQVLAQKFVGYTPAAGHVVLVAVSQGSCYIVGSLS